MMHEDIKDHSYRNYLQFKEILELLGEENLSISDIQKKVQMPVSTAYKKMKVLQNLGVIETKKYRLLKGMRRESLFGMVVTPV